MPQLTLTTNIQPNSEVGTSIRRQLSTHLASWLNKPESYCMVITHFGAAMSFGGDEGPTASVDISSLGLSAEILSELTQSVCSFLEESLQLDPARVYVRFTAPPRTHWGWDGKTFG